MVLVITNCEEEDYLTLSTHLFSRQMHLLFKDGTARVAISVDKLHELAFVASVLKCGLVFRPFSFTFQGKRYHTLEIVREKDEDTDSGDRVFS